MRNDLILKFSDECDLEDFISLLTESPIKRSVKLKHRGEIFNAKTFHVELLDPEELIDLEDYEEENDQTINN